MLLSKYCSHGAREETKVFHPSLDPYFIRPISHYILTLSVLKLPRKCAQDLNQFKIFTRACQHYLRLFPFNRLYRHRAVGRNPQAQQVYFYEEGVALIASWILAVCASRININLKYTLLPTIDFYVTARLCTHRWHAPRTTRTRIQWCVHAPARTTHCGHAKIYVPDFFYVYELYHPLINLSNPAICVFCYLRLVAFEIGNELN